MPDSQTTAPPDRPTLHDQRVGTGERRVVFLHGLFGRGKNFASIAKGLGPDFTSLLVDLPDHGRSGWTEGFDYARVADDVAAHLRADFAQDGPVAVVGHSMGGKVAMQLALRHPELVSRLVVVDIAPAGAQGPEAESRGNFPHLLDSLARLDLAELGTRAEAEERLRGPIPEEATRAFLLQNLKRRGTTFFWEPHLTMLRRELPAIMGWPDPGEAVYDGPVLWISGSESDYVHPEDVPTMRRLFPRVRRLSIKGAGHWVHADRPEQMVEALRAFLG